MPKFRQLFPYKTSLTIVALLALIAALLSLAPAARGQTVSGDATPTASLTQTDTASATGAVTRLQFTSDWGDPVGLGKSGVVDPSMATFKPVLQKPDDLVIDITNPTSPTVWTWRLEFLAPPGAQLHAGSYPGATMSRISGGSGPGIEVTAHGMGCNRWGFGSFTIQRLETDATGAVSVLEASFVQHCDAQTGPELRGIIVYNAPASDPLPALPPSQWDTTVTRFEYASDLGDYIGLGKSGVIDPSVASFSPISQWPGGAEIYISNESSTVYWQLTLLPPRGEQLHPGTYPLASRQALFGDPRPGITVGGNHIGCNADYGSFTIQRIEFDPTGAVSVLEASFVQHCESSTGPELRGVIVYNAPPSDSIPALPPAQTVPGPDSTSLSWISQSNDPTYSTENRSETYDAGHYGIRLSGDLRQLSLIVDTPTAQDPNNRVTVNLGVPNDQQLAVGMYTHTTFNQYSQTQPYLKATEPAGCEMQFGSFTIDQIGTDAYGQVDHLLAHFVIHCVTSTGPATYGTIRYRIDPSTAPPFAEATLPPAPDPSSSSFRFVSAPGEPSADGASGFYDLSTSELWMRDSSQTGFGVYVYRGAETWVLGFGLPTGHPLAPGTYTVNNPPAADGSAINVQGQLNNKSVKCNLERGSFTIYQIHTDEWDQVDSVEVGFQAQCKDLATGGYDPPVAGLLRYNVAHPLAPNTVTLPSGPWSHPGPTPAAGDLLIPASDLAPYTFTHSGLADNRAANASPLQTWHSAPYDQLGRIGGTLQQAGHGDETLFVLGSVFKDPASAAGAWSDIVDGGAWQHNQDCQRRAGTRCSLSPFLIRQGVFSQSAILQLNRCSMEVLYRTPTSHFGGQGPVESPAFDHLIRLAGERLQTACGIYDFGVAAPKILRCSGSGKSLHCAAAGALAPRRGSTVQFAYTLSVKSQPQYAAYTVRETVQDPHGRVVQRLTRTLRASKSATVSMPPVRLATSGRWTFSTTVSAGGQTKKTSASIRVY